MHLHSKSPWRNEWFNLPLFPYTAAALPLSGCHFCVFPFPQSENLKQLSSHHEFRERGTLKKSLIPRVFSCHREQSYTPGQICLDACRLPCPSQCWSARTYKQNDKKQLWERERGQENTTTGFLKKCPN